MRFKALMGINYNSCTNMCCNFATIKQNNSKKRFKR